MGAMLLEKAIPTILSRTGRELKPHLLAHILGVANVMVDMRWTRPSFMEPAKLEVRQLGIDQDTLKIGREQLNDRMSAFKAALASAKSSGTLPSKELPAEPLARPEP